MVMLRTPAVRVLDDRDAPAVLDLLNADPVANVFVQSRVEAVGLQPWRLGAEMWGHHADGRLVGLCYAGANLVPVAGDDAAVRAFGERARRQGRRCSSIVGAARVKESLWRLAEAASGARPHGL